MYILTDNYIKEILELPIKELYKKEDLITEKLLYKNDGDIEVYWAPFDILNKNAKVVLLGITPGWTQMQNSINYLRRNYDNEECEELLINTKKTASFSGSMRNILVNMLDEIKLNELLDIDSCQELFNNKNDLVHTTSVLRYPVFIKGNNYNGSTPNILKKDIFIDMIDNIFVKELKVINEQVIIIPMGKSVSNVLDYLISSKKIINKNILFNFPHPSPANAHRKKQFEQYKESFIETIKNINI